MTVDFDFKELGKKTAAAGALEFIEPGMILGLGTGSKAACFLKIIAERENRDNLDVLGVPSSTVTRANVELLGIKLTTLDSVGSVDLVVDGADEFDSSSNLIKGGGAVLQEKIVANSANRMVVITDSSKQVKSQGEFDLPVEIVRFASSFTKRIIEKILQENGYYDLKIKYRQNQKSLNFVTDEGHLILDLELGEIQNARLLHDELIKCPGVVETGLFIDMVDTISIGNPDGSCRLIRAEKTYDQN